MGTRLDGTNVALAAGEERAAPTFPAHRASQNHTAPSTGAGLGRILCSRASALIDTPARSARSAIRRFSAGGGQWGEIDGGRRDLETVCERQRAFPATLSSKSRTASDTRPLALGVERNTIRENLALNIKSEEADRLARELADRTGETLTQVVIAALRERLDRSLPRLHEDDLIEDVLAISDRFSRLPVFDVRSPDENVGYDQHGVPH